jgi:hypothetical protein
MAIQTAHVVAAAHEGAAAYGIAAPSRLMTAVTGEALAGLARMYDELPDFDRAAVPAWDALELETWAQHAALLRAGFTFEVCADDPYAGPAELFADVARFRIRVLSTETTGGHPYWSNATNDVFRAVHDVMGHAATGRGFDRHGEARAFDHHARTFSPLARQALATELRAQAAYVAARGTFPAQKIALLPARVQTCSLLSAHPADMRDALTRHAAGDLDVVTV